MENYQAFQPTRCSRNRLPAIFAIIFFSLVCGLLFTLGAPSSAATANKVPKNNATKVDAFTVNVNTDDAERFAAVFKAANGKPSAEALQQGYLNGAQEGVKIFTPYRIESAKNLSAEVAKNEANYRYAIETCLPAAKALDAELRAIYLAHRGLQPKRALPAVYLVFGAHNSGGTASPRAQVIGLEITCGVGTTLEAFRKNMRSLFAHETAHSWQPQATPAAVKDLLLFAAIREGVADYLAHVVSGVQPSAEREAWGRPQEAAVWREFEQDRQFLLTRDTTNLGKDPEALAAFQRWFQNASNAPKDRPFEAGYWVGMQIVARYVATQNARGVSVERALDAVLNMQNPQAILQASGYAGK